MSKFFEYLTVVIALAFGVACFYGMYIEQTDCNAVGGTLVKTMFWFECIKK